MKKDMITVCTPTYNRAHLLRRPFISLKEQINKNFVWIIIDDGSTDNTKTLIKEFIKEADFKIEYHFKENGGRHTALNYSYAFIDTEYVINLDSDDELVPEAIDRIFKSINSIPNVEKNRFWQISGLCIDSETKEIVGKLFPDKINTLKGVEQRKGLKGVSGEKSNCRKVDILKKYPFPIFEDTKFVTENTIWEKINRNYDTYCVNEVFRVYYQDSSDSLAKGKVHNDTRMRSRYYYSLFCLNELFDEILYNKNVLISICNVTRSAICSQIPYKTVIRDLNKWYKKLIVMVVGYPSGLLYAIFKDHYRFK